ncbi:sodium-dependent transporter [Fodinibius salsisoli]|uniref:Sodium-dependent transporter n=1 Tax=Fodinibius salsisoli TaxID=2820877 RepID=A0ABT3PKB2_9BACT|nr:sodium-dependent transporter [Fodinibius salsisoli]MCW9706349.1 sodium-dependent transporter [Fodinibius salsisoli]
MANSTTTARGNWNSKLGFVLAAAGSAVGLGNIWRFPTEAASNGGGAFLIIYLICCFLIGFPVMMAEITIGRKTGKNPVGAFKELGSNSFHALIGIWAVICGVMILSFYTVIAGWTISYVFEELFFAAGMTGWASWISDTSNGWLNALFSVAFMIGTISIIRGGVSEGIEKATKTLMPLLFGILILLIGYVVLQPGSSEGLAVYLQPDFSKITPQLIFAAMGQAFFSLSLGMGAIITYGSYLSPDEDIPQVAALVTGMDALVAFLAGLLILPAMYLAQANGIAIFEGGQLIAGPDLIFQVLPALFHGIGGTLGVIIGSVFFILLSMAALTSTISLLEVPVSYAIDEHQIPRRKAAMIIGLGILLISLVISFKVGLIGTFDFIFSQIGLPLGGILVCVFLAYSWKTSNAFKELERGHANFSQTVVGKSWKAFVMIICPVVILYNLLNALGWFSL